MHSFSTHERQVVRELVAEGRTTFGIIDFLKVGWPKGQLELSSYQQKLFVYLEQDEDMEEVLVHLLTSMDFVAYLEKNGYIHSWEAFPMKDNTVYCGEDTSADPAYLPDLALASKLLTLANKRYTLSHRLVQLVGRNFKTLAEKRSAALYRNVTIGFALVVLGLSINVISDYRMQKAHLESIELSNSVILEDMTTRQKQLKALSDAVLQQSEWVQGMKSHATHQAKMLDTLRTESQNQNDQLRRLGYRVRRLADQATENALKLKKSDSLLNKLVSRRLLE